MKKRLLYSLYLIPSSFFTLKLFLKNKKADLPGWSYIVALIIGLFVIAFIIWVAIKSTGKQTELLDFLR